MNNTTTMRTRLVAFAALGVLTLAACSSDDSNTAGTAAPTTDAPTTAAADDSTTVPATDAPTTVGPPALEGELVGTFELDAASCDGATVTGSYFKMVQPGGNQDDGPFIPNADSTCSDTTFTALTPGTDGGLVTGGFQPAPDPAYDATGNGLGGAIFAPTPFFAVAFAGGTDPTGATPSITASSGTLTGDLSAFTAYYGGASFNQGAPKPDGSGAAPTGTIDPATGAFTLEWTSLIVGGSFDGFLGVWHFEGTFTPAT